jgi:protein tyrosine phosphatase
MNAVQDVIELLHFSLIPLESYNTEIILLVSIFLGPNRYTLNDFWRMIWQVDSRCIVMATNLFEHARVSIIMELEILFWGKL